MKSSKLTRLIVGCVIVIVLLSGATLGVLMLLGPQIGQVFSNIKTDTCIYQIHVVAFEDVNGDGVQNNGESGVAGVNVNLQHTPPTKLNTPEQTVTDSKGSASINRDDYCPSDDTIMVNVVPPSGYSATTPITFGPYPVPQFSSYAMTQVAQHPIPSVIYVGLRRG